MQSLSTIVTFLRIRSAGFSTLFVGSALIFLALPRSNAALTSLSAPIAIFELEQGNDVSDDQIVQAEMDLRAALSDGVETASLNSQLSYLTLHRILSDTPSINWTKELQVALSAVELALKRRPLDAYLWTRYTHLSYLLNGLSPYTVAGLEKSFSYGAHEAALFQFRLTLCLLEWDHLPPSLKGAAQRQIEFGASRTNIWGYILADLPAPAAERLLGFLSATSADTKRAERIAASIRRKRAE